MSRLRIIGLGVLAVLILLGGSFFISRGYIASLILDQAAAVYEVDDLAGAERLIDRARFLNSENPRAFAYLCKIYLRDNKLDLSREVCETASLSGSLKEDYPNLYRDSLYNVGSLYHSLGNADLRSGREGKNNYEKAALSYEKYLAEVPGEHPQTLVLLGDIYFYSLNDSKKSLAYVEKLISLPSFAVFLPAKRADQYNLLGQLYTFEGKHADALEAFTEAERLINPDSAGSFHAFVQFNIARSFIRQGKIPDGIAKITALKNDANYNICLAADTYFLAKDFTNAITEAKKNINDPWCSYVAGIAYDGLNQVAMAKPFLDTFSTWADNLPEFLEQRDGYYIPVKSIYFYRALDKAKGILKK